MLRSSVFVFTGAALLLAACGATPEPTATSVPPTDVPSATAAPTETLAPAPDPTSTDAPAPAGGNAGVSFAGDVLPILSSRCSACHGGQRTEEGLILLSYAGVIAGSKNGPVLIAGDAANSPLATLTAEGKMPKRGPKLTPDQVQLIVDWINAGALNN